MSTHEDLIPVMKFCGKCSCGCPELLFAPDAAPERQVVMTDDFGQRIELSLDQFHSLMDNVKSGILEEAMRGAG